jgi:hypothetical protein
MSPLWQYGRGVVGKRRQEREKRERPPALAATSKQHGEGEERGAGWKRVCKRDVWM